MVGHFRQMTKYNLSYNTDSNHPKDNRNETKQVELWDKIRTDCRNRGSGQNSCHRKFRLLDLITGWTVPVNLSIDCGTGDQGPTLQRSADGQWTNVTHYVL